MTPSSNHSPVYVVAVGVRAPLGLNAPAAAAAVRGALSAIAEHPYFVDKAGEPVSVAMDPLLGSEVTGTERFLALARPAAAEALRVLVAAGQTNLRPAAIVGLPEPRPGLPDGLDRELAGRMEYSGEPRLGRVTTIAGGHAAGLMAFEESWRRIREGEADFYIAGGVDSYIDPDTLEWLDFEQQLMSGENRSGFPPGEGAGFCLLASETAARRHRLDVLAEVVAVATAREENRIKTDSVCIGAGLTEAIRRATASLRLPEEKIEFTYCDLNGERYRSEEYVYASLRTQGAFTASSDNLTPTDCWGDVGAASGPLFAALAIVAGQRRYAKGPFNLLWAGSEGGYRSAAVLRVPMGVEGD